MVVSDNRRTKNDSSLELELKLATPTLNLYRMQKVVAIIGLLCCVAAGCSANDAPPTWVNDGDANAMERVLGSVPNGLIA